MMFSFFQKNEWCSHLYVHFDLSLSFPADVKKWWIWGYWISPLSYAQNAISTNEFLGHSWSKVSEPYISWPADEEKQKLTCFFLVQIENGTTVGIGVLRSRGVFTEAKWYWIGLGALVGYALLFNLLYTVALAVLSRKYIHRTYFLHV